jgi:hypothetical protein
MGSKATKNDSPPDLRITVQKARDGRDYVQRRSTICRTTLLFPNGRAPTTTSCRSPTSDRTSWTP